MNANEMQQQALSNARNGESLANYATIIHGFIEKGIAESDIQPRVNVFTFHAWKALGRQVRKGEHGIKVCTYVPMDKVKHDDATGTDKVESWRAPRMTTVFHVSQTDPIAPHGGVVLSAQWIMDHAEKDDPRPVVNKPARSAYYSTEFTPIA